MKIRINYVSNSSSSSFICEICGREESGYDLCLSEAGMVMCKNGHLFCERHKLKFEETVEFIKNRIKNDNDESEMLKDEKWQKFFDTPFSSVKEIEDNKEYDFIWKYYYPDDSEEAIPEECPCCQFQTLTINDAVKYLMKKYNLKEESILSELKDKFNNYNEFYNYLISKNENQN